MATFLRERPSPSRERLGRLVGWHHTRVHEERITITARDAADCAVRWRFTSPDGNPIHPLVAGLDRRSPWRPLIDAEHRPLTGTTREAARGHNEDRVARYEAERVELVTHQDDLRQRYAHIHHTNHPDARRVFPPGSGGDYNRAEAVDALLRIAPPTKESASAA